MKTDTECLQFLANGSFSDLCFNYKLRRSRKYCRQTVIKSNSPICQIPPRFRHWNKGKEKRQISSFKLYLRDDWYGKYSKKKKLKKGATKQSLRRLLSVSAAQISFPCSPSCGSFNHYLQTPTIPTLWKAWWATITQFSRQAKVDKRMRTSGSGEAAGESDRHLKSLNSSINRRKWGENDWKRDKNKQLRVFSTGVVRDGTPSTKLASVNKASGNSKQFKWLTVSTFLPAQVIN